jgi:L-ascorbate metabolism protein UlaG (beta-lactamase superfamily)
VPELEVTFLGTSGFQLSRGESSILIDPFDKWSGDRDGELVYCTHRHPDHTGGIPVFMERNPEAVLVTNEQVAKGFKQFSDRTILAEDAGSYHHGNWSLRFIQLRHGIINDTNIGLIVENGGDTFGHLGDTVTYEGFYSEKVDALAVPITGGVTTSPGKAIEELKKFDTLPRVVAMHWVFRNPRAFCRRLREELPGATCIVPKKGELLPV